MHNYPSNDTFLDHNLKLHKMIEMHSKYDNMHTNGIYKGLICINNHINSCISCMLLGSRVNNPITLTRGKERIGTCGHGWSSYGG